MLDNKKGQEISVHSLMLRAFTILMILLICFIPLNTSLSLSAPIVEKQRVQQNYLLGGIFSANVSGDDGVASVVRQEDTLHYTMKVGLDGDTPDFSSMLINNIALNELCTSSLSCRGPTNSPQTGTYLCTCANEASIDVPSFEVTFSASSSVSTYSYGPITVYKDTTPPNITSINLIYKGGTDAELSFSVEDHADSGNGKCAGISRLEIYNNNGLLKSIDGNKECSYTGSAEISLVEGDNDVYIVAYDLFDNQKESSHVHILVDITPPVIEDGTLSVTKDSVPIQFIPPLGPASEIRDVNVSFNILEKNLSIVTADLSSFTTGASSSRRLSNLKWDSSSPSSDSGCTETGEDEWSCSFIVPSFNPGTGDLTAHIKAFDSAGNSDEKDLSVHLTVDSSRPVVERIFTGNCGHDRCFLHNGKNNIYAAVTEDGSGMKELVGDFSLINRAEARREFSCAKTEESGEWVCNTTINVGSFNDGKILKMKISLASSDNVGNAVSGNLAGVFTYDNSKPSLVNYSIGEMCASSENPLNIKMFIEDNVSSLKSVCIKTSAISLDDEVCADCSREEGTNSWFCSATVGNIISYSQSNVRLPLLINDTAGNTLDASIDNVNICLDEGRLPDYVSLSSEGASLSKRAVSLTDITTFDKLRFHVRGDAKAFPLAVSCDDARVGDAYLVNDKSAIFDNDERYIVLLIRQDEYFDNTLTIPCTLSLRVQSGNSLFKEPEVEEFNVSVSLIGNSTATISHRMGAKINATKQEIRETDAQIKKWKRADDFISVMADFARLTIKTDIAVAALTDVLYGVSWVLKIFGVGETFWSWVHKFFIGEVHKGIINWLYNPAPPLPGMLSVGSIFRLSLILDSCQFCESYSTLLDFIKPLKKFLNSDPYENINSAYKCWCVKAVLFNLEKKRQLGCARLSCYENSARTGVPSSFCDEAYKERMCLYYTGAKNMLLIGNKPSLLMSALSMHAKIWKLFLKDALSGAALWALVCSPKIPGTTMYTNDGLAADAPDLLCLDGAALVMYLQMGKFSKSPYKWDELNAEIKKEGDFCSGVSYEE